VTSPYAAWPASCRSIDLLADGNLQPRHSSSPPGASRPRGGPHSPSHAEHPRTTAPEHT
jgi:hypothetical protein